jgi:hypothetical protein
VKAHLGDVKFDSAKNPHDLANVIDEVAGK